LSCYPNSSEFEAAWTDYFELVLEPCGWMAVWFPSKETGECFECEVGRSGAAVVEVLDANHREFRAEVEMLRSPDTWNEETNQFSVPIIEIFPIRDQENEHLNIDRTAEALDLYRYFYKNIWRPWDEESHDEDWAETHLKNRLDLVFDLNSKTGNYGAALRLKN